MRFGRTREMDRSSGWKSLIGIDISLSLGCAGRGVVEARPSLRKAGWDAEVFEATGTPGGRVQTVRHGGYASDTGASVFGSTYDSYISLARELGLEFRPTAPYVGIRRDGRTGNPRSYR